MMRSSLSVVLLALIACSAHAANLKKQPLREWVDNTGIYRVKARLLNADQTTQSVHLQLVSGETLKLPVRRLSVADRTYLKSLANSPQTSREPVRVENIAGIKWVEDRNDASRIAVGGKSLQDDKPIMCFRALGDLSGFM